jgi:hypothetical protein
MERDENFIFTHATEIAERRIRKARTEQAREAKRMFRAASAVGDFVASVVRRAFSVLAH